MHYLLVDPPGSGSHVNTRFSFWKAEYNGFPGNRSTQAPADFEPCTDLLSEIIAFISLIVI